MIDGNKYMIINKDSIEYNIFKEPKNIYYYPVDTDHEITPIKTDNLVDYTEDNIGWIESHPSNPGFYTPDDICEKPFLLSLDSNSESNLLLNDFNCIYPLGGNLRGFRLKEFLRKKDPSETNKTFYDKGYYSNVNPFCRKSNDIGYLVYSDEYLNKGFTHTIGSNWAGSYSTCSTELSPRNGNILNAEEEGNVFVISGNYNLVRSKLNSIVNGANDRIHITEAMDGQSGTSLKHSFSGLSSGYWCFSCYIKCSLPNGYTFRKVTPSIRINGSASQHLNIFSTDNVIETSDSSSYFKIKDFYTRIVLQAYIDTDNSSLEFILNMGDGTSNSEKSNVDICGITFSKGKSPVELDYREKIVETEENGEVISVYKDIYSPLVFYPSLRRDGNWTIKYKRLILGESPYSLNDWVFGCPIPYPMKWTSNDVSSNQEELVTLIHKANENKIKYIAYCEKYGYSEIKEIDFIPNTQKDVNTRVNQGSVVGGTFPDILLGGYMSGATYDANDNLLEEGSFVSTPGIYRDVLVFNSELSYDFIKEIDGSMFSITFNGSDSKTSLLRTSLFKIDTLSEINKSDD